jgi:hypothetical protein
MDRTGPQGRHHHQGFPGDGSATGPSPVYTLR